jgi:hypothetical protein
MAELSSLYSSAFRLLVKTTPSGGEMGDWPERNRRAFRRRQAVVGII